MPNDGNKLVDVAVSGNHLGKLGVECIERGDVEQHTAQRHGKAVEDVILKIVIDFLLHNADDLRRIGLTVLHQARKRR